MPFQTVRNEGDRKKLVETYLKNRETLKKRVLDEKVGKQTFQREVASELQKPVLEQQKQLEEERQKKTDERQNDLIAKLQENQVAIVGQLGTNRQDMLQQLIDNQNAIIQALPPQLVPAAAVEGAPAGLPKSLPASTSASPSFIGMVDTGVDPAVLEQQGLPSPSHYLGKSLKQTEKARKDVTSSTVFKSLSSKKHKTKEEQKTFETLQQYVKNLKAIEAGHTSGQLQQGKKGQGMAEHRTKNPYKLTIDSMFGNLWIDPTKLREMKVEAYKKGKKVLSRKADLDLIELLTKRYNTRKEYSKQALEAFAKLIDLSDLPINTRSLKYASGHSSATAVDTPAPQHVVHYYNNPDELVNRLQLLIGSKKGGKLSRGIDNEIAAILDRLLEDGVIDKKKYENIYQNYVA